MKIRLILNNQLFEVQAQKFCNDSWVTLSRSNGIFQAELDYKDYKTGKKSIHENVRFKVIMEHVIDA